jgi:translocation protein SEC63
MLEYDDSAFYYFSIALLSAALIPFTLSLIYSALYGEVKLQKFPASCQCSRCTALYTVKTQEARSSVFKRAFYFKAFVAVFFWYLWYLNFNVVMGLESLQSFDPFMILDVPADATMKEIKKQYRRLSLSMHPDKNPDNPLAVQEFIRLTKAYNVLTDETAYENFKKYGNPDGPGSYSVAIALPRYLL